MRRFIVVVGIISVLFGLNAGPFLHVHMGEGDDHDHAHGATLHAHYFDLAPEHLSSPDIPAIEDEHHRHHGIAVNALTVRERKAQTFVAVIQIAKLIVEPSVLSGHGVDVTVRANDPPARRNSSPRSPPA